MLRLEKNSGHKVKVALSRIIMHVDLDAFFASVEERGHPEYRCKPVIVGADPKDGQGRGVVCTSNYIARTFGVYSAMPISRAWALCKDAVFLPVNYQLYSKVSDTIMKILKFYGNKFERAGIDEAFLDLQDRVKNFTEARIVAEKIKKEIMETEQLACSIGIGPNKLIAKIASDFKKPNGLTVVETINVKAFLAPLHVDKLWGIGKKTKIKLNSMKIKTIGELASYDIVKLQKKFGVLGREFYQMANGIDKSYLVEERTPKSFSREHTFEKNTLNKTIIRTSVNDLFYKIIEDTENQGFNFRTLTVKIRYENFETHIHSKTIGFPELNPVFLKNIVQNLLDPFLRSNKLIRLVGVKVSNLVLKKKQPILSDYLFDYTIFVN